MTPADLKRLAATARELCGCQACELVDPRVCTDKPATCLAAVMLQAMLREPQAAGVGWRAAIGNDEPRPVATPTPSAPERPVCTGLTASWCPIHGDCACERRETGSELDDPRCPLHALDSDHAARTSAAERTDP